MRPHFFARRIRCNVPFRRALFSGRTCRLPVHQAITLRRWHRRRTPVQRMHKRCGYCRPHNRLTCAGYAPTAAREVLCERVPVRCRHNWRARSNDLSLRGHRGSPGRSGPQAAREAAAYRCDTRRARPDLRGANLLRRQPARCLRYLLAMHERIRRHSGNSAGNTLVNVRVVNVRDVVDDGRAVHIRDVHVVDPVVIARAITRTRMPRFVRTQRKPRNPCTYSAANGQVDAPVRTTASAAHERHQRRRIHWLRHDHGSRHPRPGITQIRPSTIVERGEAPRGIVYPGPAPRRNPRPMTLVIRRPLRGDRNGRHPDFTVVRVTAPCAVRIQVFVTRNLSRYISCGGRSIFRAIAACHPLVEGIGSGCWTASLLLEIHSGERDLLACSHLQCAAVAIEVGGAASQRHRGRVTVRRNIYPEFAGTRCLHRDVRCIYFDGLP